MPEKTVNSPFGPLRLHSEHGYLTAIRWGEGADEACEVLSRVAEQLEAYFSHDLKVFDLPLKPRGDAFQLAVCSAMSAIPYGETRTYGDLARDLKNQPQPVGNACGNNSIPIVIPCHRVVGATGLGGFSAPGGIETKVALLKHEGAYGLLL